MVTGKGGVGRTTVSVALARAAARAGRKTLLMEIAYEDGVQSAVGEVLGCGRLSDMPEKVESNLSVAHLWARTGHEGFLRTILPGAALIRAALRSGRAGGLVRLHPFLPPQPSSVAHMCCCAASSSL